MNKIKKTKKKPIKEKKKVKSDSLEIVFFLYCSFFFARVKMEHSVGYITLTGDLLHEDHFRLLKACKAQCNYLIVGLVTDKLGSIQKRLPMLTYEHRRSILENCKYVDLVVEHNGETKACAWEKLKFDILFSSDEYYDSIEFQNFQKEKPHIKVVYFPKNHTVSSSDIISQLIRRFCESQRIIAVGITGNIIQYGFGPLYEIVKPLHFSTEEVKKIHLGATSDTSDVFGFYKYFDKLPRNWKLPISTTTTTTTITKFPMLAGINSARELLINERYKHLSWCTYLYSTVAFVESPSCEVTTNKNGEIKHPFTDFTNENNKNIGHKNNNQNHSKNNNNNNNNNNNSDELLLEFAHHVALRRQFPARILHIIQRHGGMTFDQWCKHVCRSKVDFDHYVNIVKDIIKTLRDDGVVHGDIHSRNILIDHKGIVSIIDFGWVTARFFELCEKERKVLDRMLEENFDLVHFEGSLQTSEATNKWYTMQTIPTTPPPTNQGNNNNNNYNNNNHNKFANNNGGLFQPMLPTINE